MLTLQEKESFIEMRGKLAQKMRKTSYYKSYKKLTNPKDIDEWIQYVYINIFDEEKVNGEILVKLSKKFLGELSFYHFGAFEALLSVDPKNAIRYIRMFNREFELRKEEMILQIIALIQLGNYKKARILQKQERFTSVFSAAQVLPHSAIIEPWVSAWLDKLSYEYKKIKAHKPETEATSVPKVEEELPDSAGLLPPVTVSIPISYSPIEIDDLESNFRQSSDEKYREDFFLRKAVARLELQKEFDELLCLSTLKDLTPYAYQVETVRKTLKQFRGRVLLADEVGLGKTIETGMILKEYLLRGMVERILILVPPSLIGQWHEEMKSKFDLSFITTKNSLLEKNPNEFWSQNKIIASLSLAKRPQESAILATMNFDLVVVDEVHHLKNRTTHAWKLVDSLKKRFLILLSATPVQNNLIELYNLLTLLKPGLFKTEKDYRKTFMESGHPTKPLNAESMRTLLKDVMIRNKRAFVDVKLPPRHALTMKLDPTEKESSCYKHMTNLIKELYEQNPNEKKLVFKHLLHAAGSSPYAAMMSLERFSQKRESDLYELIQRYKEIDVSAKDKTLREMLSKNPEEKKIVFIQNLDTFRNLSSQLDRDGFSFSSFHGSMTPSEKDHSIERFKNEVSLLLSSQSGGEGRNLQFCNTLINYDLPWNPMSIEQRIGRVHRIGQEREVFIFNLVLKETLEEEMLRILDEKINMFELVVGEIGEILGSLEKGYEFQEMIFNAWIESSKEDRSLNFQKIEDTLYQAKETYENIKSLDDTLFKEEFSI